jgi:4a-hydroxytetrahydrobiopterin dehydratase
MNMTKIMSFLIWTILVTVFIPMLLVGTITANTLESRPNMTIDYVENADIKNNLLAVHNSTIPNYIKLTLSQINGAQIDLPGWTVLNGKLHKTFVFEDFPTLFDFMFKVANASQVVNHHPNMTSTFNTLTLDYDTWSIGHAISNVDIQAARFIEMLYDKGNYTGGTM